MHVYYMNARSHSKCISNRSEPEQISFEIWNEGKSQCFLCLEVTSRGRAAECPAFQGGEVEWRSVILGRRRIWGNGRLGWWCWGGQIRISFHKMAACTLLTDLFHLGLGPAPEFQSISEGTWCRFSPLWDIWPATFRNHGLLVSTWQQGESSRG